ncbi:putative O-linked N-acetylglucosamine transferase, SPINDLY family [Piscirickettsia salmonis]|uniref:tetratricopeptide repeat protein n=1 Tax=Piscirickettsia salmonis TaxID=1238 RepID=UPI0012BAFDAE|nr:hypothetical protein [Piscirickettsia salmonis]QGP55145.1 putative O-linked N-acetylglucosamine transferase, SPINDLY family [Piscirickettsia salmonis]QGP58996.1 putative O-linked N-acetylglucosamine transferase, SPINDLY family [Piscirickettsia salmonis]QGP64710.1 putative O-linked N-acetylglucosamine transferase, SPINDLY family [Piscirickettsia salmonis]
MPTIQEKKTQSLLDRANLCFEKNNIPTALTLFLQYLEDNPDDPDILGKVGAIYLHTNQAIKALDYLEKSCNLIVTTGKVSHLLDSYIKNNHEKRGIQYFNQLPNCFDKHFALYTLYKDKDHKNSQDNFIKACQNEPNSNRLLDNIVPLYCDYYYSKSMLSSYEMLYQNQRNSIIINLLYINILLKFNDYQKAKSILLNIIDKVQAIDIITACHLVYFTTTAGCNVTTAKKIINIIQKSKLNIHFIIHYSGINSLRYSYFIKKETLEFFLKLDDKQALAWPWLPSKALNINNKNLKDINSQQKDIINLDKIIKDNKRLIFSFKKPDFIFNYLGLADSQIKELKESYSSIYTIKKAQEAAATAKKEKIALFCDRGIILFNQYFSETIKNIKKQNKNHIEYDLFIICSDHEKQYMTTAIEETNIISFNSFKPTNAYMLEIIELIKSHKFNLIYYFECGTTYYNYFFPYFRLAKVQVTGLGMPHTTGIKEMDYIIQPSSLLDSQEQNNNFSEKLIYIKNILLYKPTGINEYLEPQGLPEGNLYMLHHSHFKIHFAMDDIIKEICQKDQNAKIIIGSKPFYATLITLKHRLKDTLGDQLFKQVVTLPNISVNELCSVLRKADVMLDSFYFSAGTTAAEAIYSCLPIVSFPDIKTSHITKIIEEIYQLLESNLLKQHCIATSKKDYTDKAITIATDKSLKQELSHEIKSNLYKLEGQFERASEELTKLLFNLSNQDNCH